MVEETEPKLKDVPKAPAEESFEGGQLSLFQSFLCNTEEQRQKLSNTIEFWDSLPRYSVTQQAMNKSRTEEGLLKPITRTCKYKETDCTVTISAAVLTRRGHKGEDDVVFQSKHDIERECKAFYPSANEELVEDCLRKLAAEQYMGFFDEEDPATASGVRFSLYALREELKKRGHTRSYHEIVKSIRILADSQIVIERSDGSGEIRSSYFPVVSRVSKNKLATDPDAKWFVKFHPLVTQSIRLLTYRQFNYGLMMLHKGQLSRWLHKRLAHNYSNASVRDSYNILLSTIQRDSGLLDDKRTHDSTSKLETAFSELAEHKVLLSWKNEEVRGGRNKILDVKYKLVPHPNFVGDIKAANKRIAMTKSS